MRKHRILSVFLLLIAVGAGFTVYKSDKVSPAENPRLAKYAFKLGLDLNGGTELSYRANASDLKSGDINGAMSSLRDVIERRINIFGVSEPVVRVENPGIVSGGIEHRLLVEIPGVTDVNEAIALIGKTPQLDFMLLRPEAKNFTADELALKTAEDIFLPTGLGGQYLDGAQLQFTNQGISPLAGHPLIAISF